jgi:hypothetical protein
MEREEINRLGAEIRASARAQRIRAEAALRRSAMLRTASREIGTVTRRLATAASERHAWRLADPRSIRDDG